MLIIYHIVSCAVKHFQTLIWFQQICSIILGLIIQSLLKKRELNNLNVDVIHSLKASDRISHHILLTGGAHTSKETNGGLNS